MWRFIEEGPLLKFPLRESPFMAADPMYRDVVIAPQIKFKRITENSQKIEEHNSFLSSHTTASPKSRMSEMQSSSTVAMQNNVDVKSHTSAVTQPSSLVNTV